MEHRLCDRHSNRSLVHFISVNPKNHSLETGAVGPVFHRRKLRLREAKSKPDKQQTTEQDSKAWLPFSHCGPSPLGCQLLTSETVMGFTECCKTTSASVNLPAGRFIITVPPHSLQVHTTYEIIFEVSDLPRIEDNRRHAFQDKKDLFLFFCFFKIHHSAWHLGGAQ